MVQASSGFLCGNPGILVMQPSYNGDRDQLARAGDLWRWLLRQWCVTLQALVRPIRMIVLFDELAKQTLQMTLTQHDDMVK